jgi:hypothetical protein
MKNNGVKSILLIILIILSLYQTTRLWFDDLSDLNLFYNIINYNSEVKEQIQEDKVYFSTPEIMAIYSPAKEYLILKKTKKEFNDLFIDSINILKAIFSKGEMLEEVVPKHKLWEKRSLLFKYPFLIDSNLLLKDLNVKNINFDNETDKFNEIIIIPATDIEEYVYVYLLNDNYFDNIKVYRIKTRNIKEINKKLEESISAIEDNQALPNYMSSKNLGIKLFNNNVLLPQEDTIYTDVVYLKKPFYVDNELDEKKLEEYINGFFKDNIKWKIGEEYTDESVFVKYNNNGLIEYTNKDVQNKRDLSVVESYYLAEKFINIKDKRINEVEYYLSDYITESNKTTFYFSYKYNDVNIIMSSDYMEEANMNTPMEITVVDGQVISYKRVLLELDKYTKIPEKFNGDYTNVINKMLQLYPEEKNIKNMFLGYLLDFRKENMKLNWVIVTDNIVFTEEKEIVN